MLILSAVLSGGRGVGVGMGQSNKIPNQRDSCCLRNRRWRRRLGMIQYKKILEDGNALLEVYKVRQW